MVYEVNGWNSFCRVFELPDEYPTDFCFGEGRPVNFQMLDCFNPVPGVSQPAVTKKIWRENIGEIEVKKVTIDVLYKVLVPWLLQKPYIKPERKYLVICDFGAVIQFDSHSEGKH